MTSGLKSIIDEKRPNGGIHSFPSRHASMAFVSAEFMRKRYGRNYGIPTYALASFVAYSRVEAKKIIPMMCLPEHLAASGVVIFSPNPIKVGTSRPIPTASTTVSARDTLGKTIFTIPVKGSWRNQSKGPL
jgi:hypothetical protein